MSKYTTMTKLEQLAPHLPYGLVMGFENTKGRKITLVGMHDHGELGTSITGGYGAMWLEHCGFIPYLRPFSQLTEEITQDNYNDGKPFKMEDVFYLMYGGGYSRIEAFRGDFMENMRWNEPEQLSYGVVKILLQFHFAIGFAEREYIPVDSANNPYNSQKKATS